MQSKRAESESLGTSELKDGFIVGVMSDLVINAAAAAAAAAAQAEADAAAALAAAKNNPPAQPGPEGARGGEPPAAAQNGIEGLL